MKQEYGLRPYNNGLMTLVSTRLANVYCLRRLMNWKGKTFGKALQVDSFSKGEIINAAAFSEILQWLW